jgi:hypothetical protein
MDGAPSLALSRRLAGGRGHEIVWSVSFEHPLHREILFAWLERNSVRWPFWGAIATRQGADAFSRHIDQTIDREAAEGPPVMIQIYRAAAYLNCTEEDLLAFRTRDDCAHMFSDEPDPLLAERDMTFVDLGGLFSCLIEDAVAKAEGARQ